MEVLLSQDDTKKVEKQIEENKIEFVEFNKLLPICSIVESFQKGKIQIEHLALFDMWNSQKQAQVIECFLLGAPYLSINLVDRGGLYEVVSGAEYLIAATNFISNNLILSGMKYLTKLNGYSFNDLPMKLRNKITDSALICNIYNASTGDKYDIFQLKNWNI